MLAVYVVVIWFIPGATHWQEYQLPHLFHTPAVCERYRPKLLRDWINDAHVPFHWKDVGSSRCGNWEPDATVEGDDI